ncbi:unnamed protein product, partial [Didymodactylos carnosus]
TGLSDGDNPEVPINPSSLDYVNLLLNNHPTKILVDTGASNTFVSTLLLDKLHHKPINKQKSTYVLADGGTRLQVLGTVELQIKVKNILTTVTALVTSSLCTTIIIGSDWLSEYNANIDYHTRTITVKQLHRYASIPMKTDDDNMSYLVRLQEEIKIPSGHEIVVSA